MNHQRTLAEAQARQAALDPWTEERRRRPGRSLLRIIDLTRDVQTWMPLLPVLEREEEARHHLDGTTIIIRPAGVQLTLEQERAIVAEYDDVWRAQQ